MKSRRRLLMTGLVLIAALIGLFDTSIGHVIGLTDNQGVFFGYVVMEVALLLAFVLMQLWFRGVSADQRRRAAVAYLVAFCAMSLCSSLILYLGGFPPESLRYWGLSLASIFGLGYILLAEVGLWLVSSRMQRRVRSIPRRSPK